MSSAQKSGPRVVVVGAGSLFFGRQAIWQMVHSPHLQRGTLVLVDTDEERLAKLVRLAEMVRDANAVPLGVEGHTDWVPALPGADFVVLSFANQTVKYRGIDCAISEKYGVRMCSGDTIGPGGIFRALREFPRILECAADVERLCPEAWVINYINPSTVHGIGLMRYAPGIKSFALCDSLHMPHIKVRLAGMAGLEAAVGGELTEELDRDFDMRIAGVNHFTWLLRAEWRGADVADAIAESLRAGAAYEDPTVAGEAKGWLNRTIGAELYDVFERVPVCVSHTKEYLPYYQQASRSGNGTPPLAIWDTETRYDRHEAMWQQIDSFLEGTIPIEDYTDLLGPDHATDIIENMVGGLNRPFFVNSANRGAVTNMADDAFLELLCDIDMDGPAPRPVGEMPRGLLGHQQLILDTHELTAEAIARDDRNLLRRAMLTDPIVNSIADADAILAELLELERDAIPAGWQA